ncbi:HD domain-containing protein [Clostridium cellulovorans]|uniref:Metal-dependent phosphohydrolase HD sub domain n=1 Tax=Clostridium cellulovorans (strain ATCC 35296 / DSM 3052 / OCM 3 / 743B) TaxID=573061 RepID=D9SML4_CLOC7|nr:HD domain-containing protein [Clostridium cellulovorans]ADL49799.1 metal-dependent phosphohydrolase HD sub domain [Clostridium cellulovorans 743B]
MGIKRVRQFVIQLTDTMREEDYIYVNKYLTSKETIIFRKLSKNDQKHCVRVAKGLENIIIEKCGDNYNKAEIIKYIRLGLLHDIGKSFKKVNVINKSVLVMLNSLTKGKLIKFVNIKSIDCYYNHGEKGYEMLKDQCDDKEFLQVIRYHHNRNYNNVAVKLLRDIDDKN